MKPALAVILLLCVIPTRGQQAKPSYPQRLPYAFSNFVWWTDDELRSALKKRIPGLGDEVATITAAEGRIRDALTALLREKGIAGEVQSEEPSPSALAPLPPEMLANIPEEDRPPAGKPAVVFMLVRPKVVVGKVNVECTAAEMQALVEKELQDSAPRPGGGSFAKWRVESLLKKHGYLNEQVLFRPLAPYKEGDHYAVDLAVVADAGPKFRVAAVSGDGGPLLQGKDLSQLFTSRPGDPAGSSPFAQIGPSLRAFYEQYGFADVEVRTDTAIDREHATVSYALHVVPGPLYHLGSLTVKRLNAEQEERVRALLGMKEGDVYWGRAITQLYARIKTEPLLKGYSFSFSPMRNKDAALINLSLDFFKEGGDATVTVQ